MKKGVIAMATKAKEEFITIKHKVKVRDNDGNPVKKNGKFLWEEKEKKYRVDPDFVPSKVEEICEDFIINFCEANGKEAWLEAQYNSKEMKKKKVDGVEIKEEQPKSFVSIRSAFMDEFFNGIRKGKKEKPLTKREQWLAKRKQAD